MRITSKGQVTISRAIREQTGLLPNTDVEFIIDDGAVRDRQGQVGHPGEIRGWQRHVDGLDS